MQLRRHPQQRSETARVGDLLVLNPENRPHAPAHDLDGGDQGHEYDPTSQAFGDDRDRQQCEGPRGPSEEVDRDAQHVHRSREMPLLDDRLGGLGCGHLLALVPATQVLGPVVHNVAAEELVAAQAPIEGDIPSAGIDRRHNGDHDHNVGMLVPHGRNDHHEQTCHVLAEVPQVSRLPGVAIAPQALHGAEHVREAAYDG
mmetsp:Transcript_41655/g.120272  ORF Transcript_41655/g.120272 Transcript_41655/m.120272 type:complete len:200 (-) Transcript_41655:1647-2246(-)